MDSLEEEEETRECDYCEQLYKVNESDATNPYRFCCQHCEDVPFPRE